MTESKKKAHNVLVRSLLAQKRNEKFSFSPVYILLNGKNITYFHNSALELQRRYTYSIGIHTASNNKNIKEVEIFFSFFIYTRKDFSSKYFSLHFCVMYYLYNVLTQKLQISHDYDNENIAFYFFCCCFC